MTTWGSDFGSGGGWSDPGPDDPDSSIPDLPDGERYELVDLIGVGGMGRVFEAFDKRLERTVALKEVAPDLAGTPTAERLATEALLTADLEHPGIVSVHDAGRTDDGRLFYTMRLVRGRSLAEQTAAAETPRQRAALVRHLLDASHAVGYAHARGVLHRDLKPSNIMVGEFGETQVVDWGLARKMVEGGVEGRSAGTSGFMSPEAEAGGWTDARSDVWSLGATLKQVMGEDASPDLAAIAARALAEDPDDRYPDAHELAMDLERFLDGRRVSAYEYSPLELAKRLVVAWRAPIAVGVVAAAVLAVVAVSAYVRTSRARDRAVAAEGETRAALVQSDKNLAGSLQAQAAAALQEGRYPTAEVIAARALLIEESPVARGVLLAGDAEHRPTTVEVSPLPTCDGVRLQGERMLCFAGQRLALYDGGVERWSLETSASDARLAGDRVVLSVPPRGLEVLDAADGSSLAAWPNAAGGPGMRVRADGRRATVANGFLASIVDLDPPRHELLDVCEGAPAIGSLPVDDRLYFICRGARIDELSPAGLRTVTAITPGRDEPRLLRWADGLLYGGTVLGSVVVWDPATGERVHEVQVLDGPVDGLIVLDGPRRVAVSGDRGGVRLWNLEAEIELLRLPAPTRTMTAPAPGQLLVAGDDLRRWTLPEAPPPVRLLAPIGLASIASSPDGRFAAGARGDGVVQVWSLVDGGVVAEYRWQDRVAKWVAFTPDGSELLAHGLGDASIRRWRTDDWTPLEPYRGALLRRLGALSDGRIWGLAYSTNFMLWEGAERRRVELPTSAFDATTAPSATQMVFLVGGGQVWGLRSGEADPALRFERPGARGVAVDEAGTIALAHEDHVELVDPAGNTALRLPAGEGGVIDVALSPDGAWAAAGLLDGTARLWRVADGALVATLSGHRERVASLHFAADGKTLLTSDWGGLVRRWSLADAERPAEALVAEVEAAWQMDLSEAIGSR